MVLVLILAVTFCAFSYTLHNGLTNWDDGAHLWGNPMVRSLSLENIVRIFTTDTARNYIPLTILSLQLNITGLGSTLVYHLTNLVLHMTVGFVVFIGPAHGIVRHRGGAGRTFIRHSPAARRVRGLGDGTQRCALCILLYAGSYFLVVLYHSRPPHVICVFNLVWSTQCSCKAHGLEPATGTMFVRLVATATIEANGH